jgi:hypothetical protein
MTTFTTEDRIIAEKDGSVTINVEPIPFAGIVTLTESAPKYKELTDDEIADLIKATNDEIGWGHVRIFDFVKVFLKVLRKAQEK